MLLSCGKLTSIGLGWRKLILPLQMNSLQHCLRARMLSAPSRFYDRYSSRIAHCYRIVEDSAHAEDIFQENILSGFSNAKAEDR